MPIIFPRNFADYFCQFATLEVVWGFIRNASNRESRRDLR
jgi:hypothetical protein